MPILVVDKLTKIYPGGVKALKGISFSVERGEVYGLIGPNGAGKSTTFKIIATLLKPTSGRVILKGIDVARDPNEARKMLTFVPEEVGGYRYLKGIEYLEFVVSAHLEPRGYRRRDIEEAIEEAKKISGLSEKVLEKKIGEYSKGMKRRLQVAWALAVKPVLAVLDEPTVGLDVETSFEVRRMIRRYASTSGITVLISSHNMLEVEYICDRIALIKSGVIVDSGSPRELIEKYGARNLEEAYMEAVKHVRETAT